MYFEVDYLEQISRDLIFFVQLSLAKGRSCLILSFVNTNIFLFKFLLVLWAMPFPNLYVESLTCSTSE